MTAEATALPTPVLPSLPARAAEIVDTAWALLQGEGPEALTMRRIAEEMGIRAPSLYKHFPDKAAVEAALIDRALLRFGSALHDAVAKPGRRQPVRALLDVYRLEGVDSPHAYRLCTEGELPRDLLAPGLEEWAGQPFWLATGEPYRAQALWAFAHGMVILEIDGRLPRDSDLDRTWAAGARAFS